MDELETLKADFTVSDEYKQLNQSTNILVHYAHNFFGNTANITVVNEMFLTQENKLSATASAQLQRQ